MLALSFLRMSVSLAQMVPYLTAIAAVQGLRQVGQGMGGGQ